MALSDQVMARMDKQRDVSNANFKVMRETFRDLKRRLQELEDRPIQQVVQYTQPVQQAVVYGDIGTAPATHQVSVEAKALGEGSDPVGIVVEQGDDAIPERPVVQEAPVLDPETMASTEATQHRWDMSQLRIHVDEAASDTLQYLTDSIESMKQEIRNMKIDERQYRRALHPELYVPISPHIVMFAPLGDAVINEGLSAEELHVLERFAADLEWENDNGVYDEPYFVQIDTPLMLHRVLERYNAFLLKWDEFAASFGQTVPANINAVGEWHHFVVDELYADRIVAFQIPPNIECIIRNV
jgi:hypothetical protein